MATLRTSCRAVARIKKVFINRTVATSSIVANWNKDWKPGPFPVTPEERIAAAKKYGLRVEDYEVYPDDGTGYGDYPKLPYVSGDHRDPYEDWDYPDSKTNYNEVRHVEYDAMTEDKWDPNRQRRYSLKYQVGVLTCFMTVMISLAYFMQSYPYFQPVLPKQYLGNDLYLEKGGDIESEPTVKHYTFEPAQ